MGIRDVNCLLVQGYVTYQSCIQEGGKSTCKMSLLVTSNFCFDTKYEVHTISFQTFFVRALLLIVK